MIRSSYLAPSAVIAALSALSFHSEVRGQQATHAIHLLKPQDYYGRRAFGSPGQAWLGVYELNGTWEIRASRIRVDTIPTPRGCAREVTKVSVARTINTASEPTALATARRVILPLQGTSSGSSTEHEVNYLRSLAW